GALGGVMDAKSGAREAAAPKRSEVFGQLTAVGHIGAAFPSKISVDLRAASEKWRGAPAGTAAPAPRKHRSASLSLSTRVLPRTWVLLGAHHGFSERALERPDQLTAVSGWAAEAGVLGSLGSDLSLELMFATEKRSGDEVLG